MNPAESIRLFGLCEAMKWAHLPVDGGLYDQHPDLLEQWRQIFAARAEHEAEEERRREMERSKKSAPGGRRVAGGRRR